MSNDSSKYNIFKAKRNSGSYLPIEAQLEWLFKQIGIISLQMIRLALSERIKKETLKKMLLFFKQEVLFYKTQLEKQSYTIVRDRDPNIFKFFRIEKDRKTTWWEMDLFCNPCNAEIVAAWVDKCQL